MVKILIPEKGVGEVVLHEEEKDVFGKRQLITFSNPWSQMGFAQQKLLRKTEGTVFEKAQILDTSILFIKHTDEADYDSLNKVAQQSAEELKGCTRVIVSYVLLIPDTVELEQVPEGTGAAEIEKIKEGVKKE